MTTTQYSVCRIPWTEEPMTQSIGSQRLVVFGSVLTKSGNQEVTSVQDLRWAQVLADVR